MRRFVFLLSTVFVLVGVAVLLVNFENRRRPEWTTSSREALAALQAGLEAERKYYHQEALDAYTRALEYDPEFAMAKLQVMKSPFVDRDHRATLAEDLAELDLSRLTDREAFLVRFHLERWNDDTDTAEDLIVDYLAEYPKDPFALDIRCGMYWGRELFEQAEDCYTRLLEVDPNWVTAQNRLGYLAMAQGELEKSKDRFLTYRYVAPDQANPHDSLGELLIVQGRYREATRELEAALAIRSDFCASYTNLVDIAFWAARPEMLEGIVLRLEAEEACRGEWVEDATCAAGLYRDYYDRDWEEVAASECAGMGDRLVWLVHLGALLAGDHERAAEIEADLTETVEAHGKEPTGSSYLQHSIGLRLLNEASPETAADHFRTADDNLTYWGQRPGMFKLYNRVALVSALRRGGDEAAADRVVSSIRTINPAMAERGEAESFVFPGSRRHER